MCRVFLNCESDFFCACVCVYVCVCVCAYLCVFHAKQGSNEDTFTVSVLSHHWNLLFLSVLDFFEFVFGIALETCLIVYGMYALIK